MNLEVAKKIVSDATLSDDDLFILILKAQREATNHHFWKMDDIPTDEQKEAFLSKYEFEIYDIAKAMNSDDARDGEVSHTELGVSRSWGETGNVTVQKALSKIPRKAYVM
jgi:hypothetical protein